jgi:microcystin-dependent protein
MPSSFTPNTGLEKPGAGEQAGFWGTTVNLNSDIIDRALNGVISIALTGATYTLETTSGNLSEGHAAAIVFTGTPGTACTVTISPNTVQKTLLVRNTTDQGIIFTQGSGGNVTVVAGQSAALICNGAGATASVNFGSQAYDSTLNALAFLNATYGMMAHTGVDTFAKRTLTGTANQITVTNGDGVSGNPTVAAVVASAGEAIAGTDGTKLMTPLRVKDAINQVLPTGMIVLWSGSVASIPAGWALCNGANGTPDLRDRFVVGAGSTYAVAATGGASTVTLAVANLPAHTHTFSATTGSAGSHSHTGTTASAGAHTHGGVPGQFVDNDRGSLSSSFSVDSLGSTDSAGAHTHTFTTDTEAAHTHSVSGTTGSGSGTATAVENRPPYFALAYIMKL